MATDVLGYLVEVVSGQPFEAFLYERIFEPLGMSDTHFCVSAETKERFAELYEPTAEGGIKPMAGIVSRRFVEPPRNCSGGGGLVSTAGDYLRFCQMILNQGVLDGVRLVSRKTVELMTANHLAPELLPMRMGPNVMAGYGFGLGVRVLLDPAQAKTLGSVGEYGWGGLASTYFFIDPQEDMIGILLTQLIPPQTHPSRSDFRVLAYQSIVD
jgi:CubicO group peptidase (beta-lactamase class C family)